MCCFYRALEVLEEEKLTERSLQLGEKLVGQLKEIDNPMITEVRGKGLFIGIELNEPARPYCEQLKALVYYVKKHMKT